VHATNVRLIEGAISMNKMAPFYSSRFLQPLAPSLWPLVALQVSCGLSVCFYCSLLTNYAKLSQEIETNARVPTQVRKNVDGN
jgi:hypothetical protein